MVTQCVILGSMYRRLDVEHIDRTIKCLDLFSCRCALYNSIFNANYHSICTSFDVTEIAFFSTVI